MPAAHKGPTGTVVTMTTTPEHLTHDLGRLGAWLVLDRTDFAGSSLMAMLIDLGIAGDYDDGSPGWVDWEDLSLAHDRLEDLGRMSSGVAAALEIAVALASCQRIESLDRNNRAALAEALRAMVYACVRTRPRS